MKTIRAFGCLAIALIGMGCAHRDYYYRPTTLVSANEHGYPASRYPVPPESPRGEVVVTSFGLTELETAPKKKGRFTHARMIVVNNNADGPLVLDPGKQKIALPGHPPFGPTYVNSSSPGTAATAVPPGGKGVIDLYYALPTGLDREDRLAGFDLQWTVETPQRVVAERTPFERTEIIPYHHHDYPYGRVAVGWGPAWWMDPWHSPGPRAWWGYDPFGPRYVIINRAPSVRVHQARPAPPSSRPRTVAPPAR